MFLTKTNVGIEETLYSIAMSSHSSTSTWKRLIKFNHINVHSLLWKYEYSGILEPILPTLEQSFYTDHTRWRKNQLQPIGRLHRLVYRRGLPTKKQIHNINFRCRNYILTSERRGLSFMSTSIIINWLNFKVGLDTQYLN